MNRRKGLEQRAQTLLLSDEEFHTLWENVLRQKQELAQVQSFSFSFQCSSCFTLLSSRNHQSFCENHLLCSDCYQLALDAHVKTCPFCPPPKQTMQVRCCHCQAISTCEASENFTCSCCSAFQPSHLLRHFQRQYSFTNFLEKQEYLTLKQEYENNKFSVKCLCGQSLCRASACNELYHCGHHRICACCGAASLPWEETLAKHVASSDLQCCRHIEDDDFSKKMGEACAVEFRLRRTLEQLSLRVAQ